MFEGCTKVFEDGTRSELPSSNTFERGGRHITNCRRNCSRRLIRVNRPARYDPSLVATKQPPRRGARRW